MPDFILRTTRVKIVLLLSSDQWFITKLNSFPCQMTLYHFIRTKDIGVSASGAKMLVKGELKYIRILDLISNTQLGNGSQGDLQVWQYPSVLVVAKLCRSNTGCAGIPGLSQNRFHLTLIMTWVSQKGGWHVELHVYELDVAKLRVPSHKEQVPCKKGGKK